MDFGLVLDSIVALLTLGTVFVSYKAAKSAETSAMNAEKAIKHSEDQTNLMISDYKRNTTPRLIPSSVHYSFGSISILSDMNRKSANIDNDLGTIQIKVKNLGKGSAYYIDSYIELDEMDSFLKSNYMKKSHPSSWFFPYNLEFSQTSNEKTLFVHEKKENSKGTQKSSKFKIDLPTIPHTYLVPDEEFSFHIPAYIQALLLDTMIEKNSNNSSFDFTLVFKYQTEHQLLTSSFTQTKFEVVMHNIFIEEDESPRHNFILDFFPTHTINE